jgi:putative DNA primase/helicase
LSPTAEPPIIVSTAPRADSKVWKQKQTDWPGYLDEIRLTDPADKKECGGLLPAALRSTTRSNNEVVARYVATLDADSADLDLPQRVLDALPGVRLAYHSTWRHSLANPRYRFHVPFSRDVTPAEYTAVARSLVRFLGAESFDLTTSQQPAQFAWLASTSDPQVYEYGTQDGDLLDPDHWLGDADADARTLGVALEEDDAAPTPAQIDKAITILRKYEKEVSTLKDSRTGARLDGRNIALISRLPTLYRFVLSGCLTEALVHQSMWEAVSKAPGDHPFEEAEYRTVTARALKYAEDDGPGKPTVVDDFTSIPLPPDTSADDSSSPARDFTTSERLDIAGIMFSAARWKPNNVIEFGNLTRHLTDRLDLAASEYQGSPQTKDFMTYMNGCWREDGTELVRAALVRIFDDTWKPTIENTVLGMLSATADLPTIPIETPNPHLVNLANGMYDLTTAALLPHDTAYFSRVQIPHPYVPDAECPAFDRFLADVLRPDQIPTMWEVLGYALYPTNPLHRAVLLHGPTGRNGKSTLLHVLSALVGQDNTSNLSLSTLTNSNTGRFAINGLRGRLVNLAGEQEAGAMPTALIKQLISGDPLSADRKNKDFVTFTPHALQVIATNSNITSKDNSEALADRFVIFRFEKSFYGREDPFLLSRISTPAELQGILARALVALRTLLDRGRFDLPASMQEDRSEYAAAMGGSVREWLHAYTIPDPDGRVKKTLTWQSYQNACLLDNVRVQVTKQQFYRALEGVPHIELVKIQGDMTYKGIMLTEDAVTGDDFL